MRTQRINNGVTVPFVQLILYSSIILLLLLLFVGGAIEWQLLGFSLFSFCFYSSIATDLEKKNVVQAVEIEYKSTLGANILLSGLVALNYFYSGEVWIGFIFGRFLCFHIIYIILASRTVQEIKLKKLASKYDHLWPPTVPLYDIIIGSFAVKFSYFFIIQVDHDEASTLGFALKLVLIGYDICAAVMGLFMRRVVANNSNDKYKQNKLLMLSITSFSILSLAIILLFDFSLYYYVELSILPLFVLAALFIPISNFPIVIRVAYVIILIAIASMIYFVSEKMLYLLLFLPSVLSVYMFFEKHDKNSPSKDSFL